MIYQWLISRSAIKEWQGQVLLSRQPLYSVRCYFKRMRQRRLPQVNPIKWSHVGGVGRGADGTVDAEAQGKTQDLSNTRATRLGVQGLSTPCEHVKEEVGAGAKTRPKGMLS